MVDLVAGAHQLKQRPRQRVGLNRSGPTGGVITSAGVLLAAVFTVLGVLPVIVLTQIGVIVGIGVLVDTLLVRTVIVPALGFLAGERFWWPAHPARRPDEDRRTDRMPVQSDLHG